MSTSLNKDQIINLLPHREPMLLIDELLNIKKLFSATAIVNVKKDSFFVQGHFPGRPVMPGVLIVEAFGQAAAALTAHGIDKTSYETTLAQKEAILQKDIASLKLSNSNVKRYTPLVKKGLAPQEKLDQFIAEQKQVEATILADKANIKR